MTLSGIKINNALPVFEKVLNIGILGAAGGFVYAQLEDLPVKQVTLAFAIFMAAEQAIFSLASCVGHHFKCNDATRLKICTIVSGITSALGLHEIHKRGLIGPKMLVFALAVRIIPAVITLFTVDAVVHQSQIDALSQGKKELDF